LDKTDQPHRHMKKEIKICLIILWIFATGVLEASSNGRGRYARVINEIARKHRVESTLIHSIIKAESNYNRLAVSSKGAVGLMQLMPQTGIQYGANDLYDPRQNIEAGVKYLRDLIRLYNGKTNLVLAAYNAGQEAVKKYKGVPPYPETRNYIEKVKKGYSKSHIAVKTSIYKFYDQEGRLVFTNDYSYYVNNRRAGSEE